MDAATARAAVQRDLRDESAARWTANEIDRALARALDEYSLAWPVVTSKDVAKGATDTLDVSAEAGYIYALWCEYPTGNVPPTAVRFREERKGYIRLIGSTPPVQGETVRVWYAKGRASTFADLELEHEDIVFLGAAGFAAMAAAVGSTGAVNASGWTPKQYKDWGEATLKEFRARLAELRDRFNSGAPVAVWSSAKV